MSRREVLALGVVAGGAAVMVTSAVAATRPSKRNVSDKTADAAVQQPEAQATAQLDETTRALFAPILADGRVGGCTLVAVHAVKMGAIPVVLAAAGGTQFQVDVLRRDAQVDANGVRVAGSLTAVLHNRGAGGDPTHEEQGLGVMALLEVLSAREAAGAAVPALLTLRERNVRFPRGVLSAIV
ncbi:MAG: hypothetical protein WCJ30_12490 [Deltaproteobacteria bacterium]